MAGRGCRLVPVHKFQNVFRRDQSLSGKLVLRQSVLFQKCRCLTAEARGSRDSCDLSRSLVKPRIGLSVGRSLGHRIGGVVCDVTEDSAHLHFRAFWYMETNVTLNGRLDIQCSFARFDRY